MILLIAGTSDSKKIIIELTANEQQFIATVATEYGASLFKQFLEETGASTFGRILETRFTLPEVLQLIEDCGITKIIDASHPFALNVTNIVKEAAFLSGTEYERINRENDPITKSSNIHIAQDFEEAAKLASKLGSRVFLTIGTNHLFPFIKYCSPEQLVVRVLDWDASIEACHELGVPVGNVITGKGPFTAEENISQFIKHKADVVVTKNSGKAGGLNEKLAAAHTLELPIIIVERPQLATERSFDDISVNLTKEENKTEQ